MAAQNQDTPGREAQPQASRRNEAHALSPHLVVLGEPVASLHNPRPGLLKDVRHGHELGARGPEREGLGVDLFFFLAGGYMKVKNRRTLLGRWYVQVCKRQIALGEAGHTCVYALGSSSAGC